MNIFIHLIILSAKLDYSNNWNLNNFLKIDLHSEETKEYKTVEKNHCFITGTFVNKKPQGFVTIKFKDDNSYAHATMKKGKLNGDYHLFKEDGTEVKQSTSLIIL